MMHSKLSLELDVAALPSLPTYTSSTKSLSPLNQIPGLRQKSPTPMSLTQTYRIASSARNKLGREAMQPEHNLRLLVGHANLLDSLMLDLADAERQQEAWFNQTLRKAAKLSVPKHVKWMDTVAEHDEPHPQVAAQEDFDIDSDVSDDDEDDLMLDIENFPSVSMSSRRRSVTPPPIINMTSIYDLDEDDAEIDDELDDAHALVRMTPLSSDVPETLPALEHDDSDSDDSPLPSPASEKLSYFSSKKSRAAQMAAASDLIHEHLLQPTIVI